MTVSIRTLNILAALFWYGGGLALLWKGGSLIADAAVLDPGGVWPWMAGICGLCLGALKAKWLFAGSCRRNLRRIAALEKPRLWQFFRPGFFAVLLVMILISAALSRLIHGHYAALLSVVFLDWSIAAALLGSSAVFWKENALVEPASGRRP